MTGTKWRTRVSELRHAATGLKGSAAHTALWEGPSKSRHRESDGRLRCEAEQCAKGSLPNGRNREAGSVRPAMTGRVEPGREATRPAIWLGLLAQKRGPLMTH